MSEATSNKRTLEGVVVSNKAEQTIVVQVERKFLHPRYRKTVRSHKKYMAHDAENTCNIGDTVRIIESAPISRRKRWQLITVLTRAEQL
ncbi:MAG: 30S ribosomal protein S17 [Zetaproteobacteria bacterium CG12_big_fil_rev_8_21_14_0_65_54_13]|nr:MAG: 30S ribosomal protein S17 [Zetaproteobacteria bacterium CG23_combo_of_CG06-09_8_20_14_all_54_7]PIW49116.1 MAG: 30S ribosomal protein S17 [Zetaproteobacteria bacterium CG12_big_fil_rev_8_21_14_0_65_54_13]PIX55903.1 MAG: 30S ribosomal protein S17 [Zetaproteobacteria bacterium CG_4_10_14_3_um_filter_54_28]PJA30499.1 MAG: 30S ribosomal protein S17 [Zetaproteobacteria bacterium CG_4_9_14_3_um_filter_54_145]